MQVNKILEKYKLLISFEVELDVDEQTFIKGLEELTNKGYYTSFLISFDCFKSKNREYIGNIKSNSLRIRERFGVHNARMTNRFNSTIVKAEFKEEYDKLNVRTVLQGMEFLPFLLRVIIFGIYLLLMLLFMIEAIVDSFDFNIENLLPPLILTLVVALLTYLPYVRAKENITLKRKDIELIFENIAKYK